MKKVLIFLSLLVGLFGAAHAFTPVRQVQISTGSIPQQSGYYNVAGGTVTNLANYNQISSGTYTVNGGTFSWMNGVSTGTRFDRSTTTFQGGEFSGTRNDNSTTTLIGAVVNGTRTDNSTTTWTGQNTFSGTNIFNGLLTENSTNTFTGGNTFNNWTTFTASQTVTGSTIAYSAAVVNGTKTDNSTTTYTGTTLFNSSTSIKGTTTNDNAAQGYVGELVSATLARSGVTFSSNTTKSLGQFTLTAGDWDLVLNNGWAVISGNPGSTVLQWGISTTTNTMPSSALELVPDANGQILGDCYGKALALVTDGDITCGAAWRTSISATTTYYYVLKAAIATGSIGGYGSVYARRRR